MPFPKPIHPLYELYLLPCVLQLICCFTGVTVSSVGIRVRCSSQSARVLYVAHCIVEVDQAARTGVITLARWRICPGYGLADYRIYR